LTDLPIAAVRRRKLLAFDDTEQANPSVYVPAVDSSLALANELAQGGGTQIIGHQDNPGDAPVTVQERLRELAPGGAIYIRANREHATITDPRYGLLDPGDPMRVRQAWNDALQDVKAAQGAVLVPRLPDGLTSWDIDEPILIDNYQRTFADALTNVRQVGGAKPAFRNISAGVARVQHPSLDNFNITNSDTTLWTDAAAVAVEVQEVSHLDGSRLIVRDWHTGIKHGGTVVGVLGGYYNSFRALEIANCTYGIDAIQNATSTWIQHGRIHSCRVGWRGQSLSHIGLSIAFERNYIAVQALAAAQAVDVSACRFEGNGRTRTPEEVTVLSGVAYVTMVRHFYFTGDILRATGHGAAGLNGFKTVSVTAHNAFNFPAPGVADGTYSTSGYTFALLFGGAHINEPGAFGNLALGGHHSSGNDRSIDRDGRNAAIVLSSGHHATFNASLAGSVANGDMRADTNADGVANGVTIAAAAGLVTALDPVVKRSGRNSQLIQVDAAGTSRRDASMRLRVTPGMYHTLVVCYATDAYENWNLRCGTSVAGTTYGNSGLNAAYPAAHFDDGATDKGEAFSYFRLVFKPASDEAYVTFYMNTSTAAAGVKKRLWIDSVDVYPGVVSGLPGSGRRVIVDMYTSAERDAIGSWQQGEHIYNVTTGREEIYLDGIWVSLGLIGAQKAAAVANLASTDPAEMMSKINSILTALRAASLMNP